MGKRTRRNLPALVPTTDPLGGSPAREPWHARFGLLGPATSRKLDELLTDPALLDTRRPVALAELAMTEADLIPNEDLVWMRAIGRFKLKDGEEPNEAQLASVRADLAYDGLRMVESYARIQQGARRTADIANEIRDHTLPLFLELGHRVQKLLNTFVPEARREDARAALKREVAQMMARALDTSE